MLFVSIATIAQERFDELIWSDEFNTTGAPNPTFWSYDLGTGQGGWGNNEVQSYTQSNSNIRQENGLLIIDAIKSGSAWTSARIKTQNKFNFTYGRVEFRAKLPTGSGTWPALWLLGESITSRGWPACGEIDVMEFVGKNPDEVHASLHSPSSFGNTQNTQTVQVPNASNSFKVYAVDWSPESIKFYVDDLLYYTYSPSNKNDSNWPFKDDFFIIINMAMGGNFGSDPQYETNGQRNGIDPNLTRATFEVDYVRVYQTFEELNITAPRYVQPNQAGITLNANNLTGADYEWEVPAGVDILSGQGTPSINVDWNDQSGSVVLNMTYEGQVYTKTVDVKTIFKPTEEVYSVDGFQTSQENAFTTNGGTFDLELEDESLKVTYDITNPSALPTLSYTPAQGLNLIDHPILEASIRTFNSSQTVSMRIDLEDAQGRVTSGNQVFTLLPLIADGAFYDYAFDFSGFNGSGQGQVDLTAIAKIRILINYGIFGSPGRDSLWIDELRVRREFSGLPNRPSNLSIAKNGSNNQLTWRDRATDEQGFQVYRRESAGEWEMIAELPADRTTYEDASPDPTKDWLYRLQAFNAVGQSLFSNEASVTEVVTSIEDEAIARQFAIYPNPSSGDFTIDFPAIYGVQEIRVFDLNGREVSTKISTVSPTQFTVSVEQKSGLYACRIVTNRAVIIKKIFIK